jgi:DNA-binding transcriptional LysR family regulator
LCPARRTRRQAIDLETYVTTPVTVPNTYLIPRLVAETGMISHLPRRIAAEVLRGSDLVMVSPLPEWHIDMYWGAASASEATSSWIRSRLSEIGQTRNGHGGFLLADLVDAGKD